MSIVTYPLNNIEYDADDAALFHCTRNSGLHAGDDFSWSCTGSDNTITLQPGLAWMRINKFKGQVCAEQLETAVDMGLPDANLPRLDHVVLQFNANNNATSIVVKSGNAASTPVPPTRLTTEAIYELHLLQVRREPGAVAVTAADVNDLRLDSTWCGLMADSVTSVDTSGIQAKADAMIKQIEKNLAQTVSEELLDGSVTRSKLANDALYSPMAGMSSAAPTRSLYDFAIGTTIRPAGAAVDFTINVTKNDNIPIGAEYAIFRHSAKSLNIVFGENTLVALYGEEAFLPSPTITVDTFGMIALKKLVADTNNDYWLVTGPAEVV